MKDFGKKLISAAMALTLAASMSVYAEEVSPVESVNGGVMAVISENAVNDVVGCANHVTFRTDEYVATRTGRGEHTYNGNTCNIYLDIYQYDLICMKCHVNVKSIITKTVTVHSISHP